MIAPSAKMSTTKKKKKERLNRTKANKTLTKYYILINISKCKLSTVIELPSDLKSIKLLCRMFNTPTNYFLLKQ